MNSPTPDFTWLFLRMTAGLVLVLALAVVLIRFVLPRLKIGRSRAPAWGRVLDRIALEPHRSLYLVKIAGRFFVLGATEHSIGLITEVPAAEGEKIENA